MQALKRVFELTCNVSKIEAKWAGQFDFSTKLRVSNLILSNSFKNVRNAIQWR